jgi:hypothetical protein
MPVTVLPELAEMYRAKVLRIIPTNQSAKNAGTTVAPGGDESLRRWWCSQAVLTVIG